MFLLILIISKILYTKYVGIFIYRLLFAFIIIIFIIYLFYSYCIYVVMR